MSRQKTSRQGRKTLTHHESARRINTFVCYPLKASNGSTVTVSATDRGLHITWTGGRQLYFASPDDAPQTNGQHDTASLQQLSEQPDSDDEALFESEGEDDDEDQPNALTVQDVDIPLPSPAICLAPPAGMASANHRLNADDLPTIFRQRIVVALACADGSAYALTLPLDPPSAHTKSKRKLGAHLITLAAGPEVYTPRAISVSWTADDASAEDVGVGRRQTRRSAEGTKSGISLLIAYATSDYAGHLHFYRVPIVDQGEGAQKIVAKSAAPFHSVYLKALPTAIAFNPSPTSASRHSKLLIADVNGFTSVYDISPPAPSAESTLETAEPAPQPHFTTRLSSPFSTSTAPVHRKKPLSATWVLSGTAILTLLEDGTLGLYALSTPTPSSFPTPPPLTFACTGFIGDAPEHVPSSTPGAKPKRAHLAPMTPNTRRTKSETLFSGPAPRTAGAARGGIATRALEGAGGSPDDAVVLWYGNRVFGIPSLMDWWARSAGREASLYGTGIAVLDDVELAGECITAVAILPSDEREGGGVLGGKTWRFDVRISGEYRSVVLGAARSRVERVVEREEGSPSRMDRRLLERGELGIDGMGRMLDSMVGVEHTSRRVGFLED